MFWLFTNLKKCIIMNKLSPQVEERPGKELPMYCLKCGRETGSEKIFCAGCLEIMGKNPVKAGTRVILPNRDSQAAIPKKRSRKTVSPEEQLPQLKKQVRKLCFFVVILSLLVIFLAYLHFLEPYYPIILPNGHRIFS